MALVGLTDAPGVALVGSAVTAGAGGGGEYLHHALFYDSPQDLVGAAGPFLRAGLAAGDLPVLVCSDRNSTLLTEALRGEAEIVVLEPASIYPRGGRGRPLPTTGADAAAPWRHAPAAADRGGRLRAAANVGRMDPVRGDREPRARALSTRPACAPTTPAPCPHRS